MIGLLLSGGLDSTAIAYMHRPDIAFNINYGQHSAEAESRASAAICDALGIELITINVDCSELGSGDLMNKAPTALAPESDWWPFRNQLLITLCAMKAIEYCCTSLLVGAVKSDGYHADSTPEFIENVNRLMASQEGGIQIVAPAIELTAVELIKKADIPFDLLAWSHSCHKANFPCTDCRGCNKHYNTLHELGYYG